MVKVCTTCKIDKPLEEFTKSKFGKYGKTSKCKSCEAARFQKLKNTLKAAGKTTHNNTHKRRHILKKVYGLSEVDYNKLLESQNKVCGICKLPELGTSGPKRTPKAMAVDHNHKTNAVRGLLCGMCNTALGLFKDDPRLLSEAINYLERTGADV